MTCWKTYRLVPRPAWESKESISLAFVTAMQHLPPRQRATLLLRDVLGFRAAEVAGMLGTTEDSVNGALRRARSTIATRYSSGGSALASLPRSGYERGAASRFADAIERGAVDDIIDMLTEDVRLTMPPEPYGWYGRDAVARFLSDRFSIARHRLVPTQANGQPAFGLYVMDVHSPVAHAHGLLVLTMAGGRISAITRFMDNSIMARFGLPRSLPD